MASRSRPLSAILALTVTPLLAHAQRAGLAGVVLIAGSGQPLAEAEATLLDLQRSALSGADGQFMLRDIPPGSYLLRLRRIGYQPELLRVVVAEGAPRPDTFRLQRQAVNLPELEVEGHLPRPTVNLQVEYTIDARMSIPAPRASYSPWGAVLSDDMEGFVFAPPRSGEEPELSGRLWYHELSGYVQFGVTVFPCRTRKPGPVAVQVFKEGPTYLILFADGLVQLAVPLRPGREPFCRPLYRLPADVHPIHAAGFAGRWVVTALDGEGNPVALGFEGSALRWRLPLASWLPAEDLASARVAARGSIATIASNRWPFAWLAVDTTGAVRTTGGPFTTEPRDSASRFERFMGADAFPVLPIENGYLQTLAGPSGEPRVNVVYDLLGRVVELQQGLGIPLFLASAPTVRRLLGVHLLPNKNRVGQLVEYGY